MDNNIGNNKVKIRVNTIISKCKRKEDWINFARELGNYFIKFCRILFSSTTWIRWKIFHPIFKWNEKGNLNSFTFLVVRTRTRSWLFIPIFCWRPFIHKK